MSPAAIGAPPTLIGFGVMPPGYDAEPAVGNTTPRRMIPVAAHSIPSPKVRGAPSTPFAWKKRPGPGMSVAVSTSVSLATEATPPAASLAPLAKLEFAHPRPAAPLLPQPRHVVPTESPVQNDVVGVNGSVTNVSAIGLPVKAARNVAAPVARLTVNTPCVPELFVAYMPNTG